jgi:hypothetical protein
VFEGAADGVVAGKPRFISEARAPERVRIDTKPVQT